LAVLKEVIKGKYKRTHEKENRFPLLLIREKSINFWFHKNSSSNFFMKYLDNG
jgi:hypothetical protein